MILFTDTFKVKIKYWTFIIYSDVLELLLEIFKLEQIFPIKFLILTTIPL